MRYKKTVSGTKYTYGYDDTGYVTSIGYGGTGENDSVSPLLQYSYNATINKIIQEYKG